MIFFITQNPPIKICPIVAQISRFVNALAKNLRNGHHSLENRHLFGIMSAETEVALWQNCILSMAPWVPAKPPRR
jgi:hypothetical protein